MQSVIPQHADKRHDEGHRAKNKCGVDIFSEFAVDTHGIENGWIVFPTGNYYQRSEA
jgi:hypothetical protein